MPRDPTTPIRTERTHVSAGPQAPGDARHWARWLVPFISPPVADDLRVAISELVSNSVLHAGLATGQPIHLSAKVFVNRISVSVCDCGSGFSISPEPTPPSADSVSGRGLFIVHGLCERVMMDGPLGRVRFDLSRTTAG